MAWNKKKNQSTSNNKKQYFWITCPKCKEKYAIPPEWVFKYLECVGYEQEK